MSERLFTPVQLIAAACLIEILSMMTLSTFPSLIPVFRTEWGITNTEAGTISGLFFAGELLAVTVLSLLTDRMNAKPIFIVSLALGAVSAFGFMLSNDVWMAGFWRTLQGVALGGTYMPGLKILTDHLPVSHRARGTSFYTATYYLAAGFSYFLALEAEPLVGWEGTFALAGIGPTIAMILAFWVIPSSPPPAEKPDTALFDFRPVLRNKRALGLSILYGLHNMELIAFSSWLIPFFVFSQSVQSAGAWGADLNLGSVAALVSIVALPASIIGNEIAQRIGRQVVIMSVMVGSATVAVGFGALGTGLFFVLVFVAFVYSVFIAADSSTISAGVIHVADPKYKGTTISMYSVFGFTGAAIGPIIFGGALDVFGGETNETAWFIAFSTIAALGLLGPIALWRLVGFKSIDP